MTHPKGFLSRLISSKSRGQRRERGLTVEWLEDRCLLSTVWVERGGNAGHTSYVDESFNPASLTQVWDHPLGYVQSGTGSWAERAVAIDDTHVYRTELEGYAFSGTYHVFAFDLQTGNTVWHDTFQGNSFEGVGEPSVAGGIVYVNRAGHSGNSGGTLADWPRIYGLNAQTGATVLEHRYQEQWESNERPAIKDNQLVVEDGYYGGMSSYAASTLTQQWYASGPQLDQPLAAMDNTYVYAYGNQVFLRTTGTVQPSITHPQGLTTITDPMVSDSGRVLYDVSGYVNNTQLYGVSAYDGNTHAHLWTTYFPSPVGAKAVGNGIVAVTAGTQLFLLNEVDGTQIRTWQTTDNAMVNGEILLTRTHAFVQSVTYGTATVRAIALATGQQVWSYTYQNSTEGAIMEMAYGGGHLLLSHHMFQRAFALGAVNQPPVAQNGSGTTAEDTALNGTVTATDPDGNTLSYAVVAGPAHGTLTSFNAATGTFTYTPALNYNGPDSFTFKANDGQLDSNAATVSITVTPVNDAPVAQLWQFGTPEDTPLSNFLRASDVDGNPLTFSIVSGPANGTVQITNTSTGTFTYQPNLNYNGTDSFRFKVNDGQVDSNIATVFVTVAPVNDPPVAQGDSYSTAEDTALTVAAPGVLGNDSDVEGNMLRSLVVTVPSHGILTLNLDGSFAYTPAANYNGPDSFTYKANDGTADSNVATVSLTVTPVNDAPVATNGSATTAEDTALSGAVSASDVDGDALTFAVVSGPTHGSLTLNSNGTFTYTPALNYNGPDSFTFKANDGQLDSNVATESITITPVNDAPVAANGSATTAEDTALAGSVSASDVDGDVLTFAVVVGPAHGSLTLNSNGTFTYTPALNYNGPDSFTFRASDGSLLSNTATFTLSVTPVNDAPAAGSDAYTMTAGTTLNVAPPGILANDSDVDGDTLTAQLVSGPSHGSLTFNANGSFTYTPAIGFTGTDTFTYRASDGSATSGVATVTLTVNLASQAGVTLEPDPCTPGAVALVIRGTSGDDDISITRGNSNRIDVAIHSIGFAFTGSYSVTFARIIVHGLAGDDNIRVQNNISLPAWLFGEAGNDVLQAGSGSSLLVGGDGNDSLQGGKGLNVLIGGRGADQLRDGSGDSILIGGYTDYDANLSALCAIVDEWTSGDSYSARVASLRSWLNDSTVHDDGDADLLNSAGGMDWLFACLSGATQNRDRINGDRPGQVVTNTSGW